MARALRIEYPSAYYHVISRGIEKRSIYKTVRDRLRFLEFLQTSSERHQLKVYAYCLMDNHYHILLQTLEGNLSKAMKFINGSYATYFNAKNKRVGHLFASRYKAILVENDSYLMELSRYIHLNPVRAQIVQKPEEYRWSSYKAYLEAEYPEWLSVDWMLKVFSTNEEKSRLLYQRFVEQGIDGKVRDPLKEIVAGMIQGRKSFVEEVRQRVKKAQWESENIPAVRELKKYRSFEEIETLVAEHLERNLKLQRKISIYLSHKHSGRRLKEIGVYFGDIKEAAVSLLVKRLEEEVEHSEGMHQVIQQLEIKLSTFCKM